MFKMAYKLYECISFGPIDNLGIDYDVLYKEEELPSIAHYHHNSLH